MNNFLKRIITGFLYVVVVINAIIWKQYFFSVFLLLVMILGMIEFYRITNLKSDKIAYITGLVSAIMLFIISALVANKVLSEFYLLALILIMVLSFIPEIFARHENFSGVLPLQYFGILYIAVPLMIFNYFMNPLLHEGVFLKNVVVGYFVILWVNDSGAYVVGKLLGKTPLFERISPKKTWEGAFGGAFFGIVSAWILSIYFEVLSIQEWIIFAGLIIIFSTLGDLFESKIKRAYDIKDSGSILPGHGGILDRFDGVLLSVPVVYVFLVIIFWLR